MTLSEQLADFVVATPYEAIPGEAIACAKRLIVDTLAVAWAGTSSDGSADMLSLVTDEGGKAEAAAKGGKAKRA